jgi:hypothetical protein
VYLALLQSMYFLNTSCDRFFCVFKVEEGPPLGTSSDFYSTEFSILLLQFQDYLDRVGHHLGLA